MKQILHLRGISDHVKGAVWKAESRLRIGREDGLEIVLNRNSISRRHAEIRRVNNRWWVRDLNSRNGTYVNGSRLGGGVRQIHTGDVIEFSAVKLMVESGSPMDESGTPQQMMNLSGVGSRQATDSRNAIALRLLDGTNLSPAWQRWAEAKRRHPGRLVLLSARNCYETFSNDAQIVTDACDLPIDTNNGQPRHLSFPCAELDLYLGKLLDFGLQIALCDKIAEVRIGDHLDSTRQRDPSTVTYY